MMNMLSNVTRIIRMHMHNINIRLNVMCTSRMKVINVTNSYNDVFMKRDMYIKVKTSYENFQNARRKHPKKAFLGHRLGLQAQDPVLEADPEWDCWPLRASVHTRAYNSNI